MSDELTDDVTYRCWCEHDDCDWERTVVESSNELAQRVSGAAMAGHGLHSGHYETKRARVETDGGREQSTDDTERYSGRCLFCGEKMSARLLPDHIPECPEVSVS